MLSRFPSLLTCLFLSWIACPVLALATPGGQENDLSKEVAAAAEKMQQQQTYELKYKLNKGETLKWKTVHNAATKTQMAGFTGESSSYAESVKSWSVSNVDSRGNMTFVVSLESTNCWQKTEEETIRYNSQTDKEAPEQYQAMADQVGKSLVVFSVAPNGEILDRKSSLISPDFGIGEITTPLPNGPVAVGHTWDVPKMLSATDEQGRNRKLKARIAYELAKVVGKKAYIKFRTEVLTPLTSEKIKSQIMQQLAEGYLVFDLEHGRPVTKQVEWDEKAQGFEGPDSLLTYIGRMEETLLGPGEQDGNAKSESEASDETAAKPATIRTQDGEPVIRR